METNVLNLARESSRILVGCTKNNLIRRTKQMNGMKKGSVVLLAVAMALSITPFVSFAADFVPVDDIVDVPTEAVAGTPLTLTGSVLPNDATNMDIIWSVKDAGMTGAYIEGNTLYTTAGGTAVVTAAIVGGLEPDSSAQFAIGNNHTVAIKTDGSLWAWGMNAYGQLGDGTTTLRSAPIRVGNENDWVAVAAGYYHTTALKKDGSLWAWGNNSYGQLGDGTTTWRTVPVRIGTGNDWAAIWASTCSYHVFALKTDGSLWAWGNNTYGQLGDGTTTLRNAPVRVGLDNNWASVSPGHDSALGLRTDGSLWAWGNNLYGQHGNGTYSSSSIPVRVGSENDWAVISAGCYYGAAIKADGSLWAWGTYGSGRPGPLGTTPSLVGTDNDWSALSSRYHLDALKNDGSMWAWGLNTNGQIGDGTYINRSAFVRVGEGNDWGKVSASNHTVALKLDGSLWAWGLNSYG